MQITNFQITIDSPRLKISTKLLTITNKIQSFTDPNIFSIDSQYICIRHTNEFQRLVNIFRNFRKIKFRRISATYRFNEAVKII